MSIPAVSRRSSVLQEIYDAISKSQVKITRRIEIYSFDGETLWEPDYDIKFLDGSVNVNYDGETRRSCDFTFASEVGARLHAPGALWYDKILKPFRGISYMRPKSYMEQVISFNPRNFWRTVSNSQIHDIVKGVHLSLVDSTKSVPVADSHNSAWEEGDKASRFYGSNSTSFRATSFTIEPAITPNFTVELWTRFANKTASATEYLIELGSNLATQNLSVRRTTTTGLLIQWNTSSIPIPKSSIIDPLNWNHIVITVEGTQLKVYVNGSLAYTVSTGTTWAINNLSKIAIGASLADASRFSGSISDVALYQRVLTPWEIDQNYLVGTDAIMEQRQWEVQCGEFMIDGISSGKFPGHIKITGRDYFKKLEKAKFQEAVTFSEGTRIDVIIESIARNAGIKKFNLDTASTTLPLDVTFDRMTSRLTAIKDLAALANIEVFFDAYGYLVTRPFIDPSGGVIAVTLAVGKESNIVDYSYSSTDALLINKVIVTGESPSEMQDGQLYFGVAINDDPNSLTSTVNIGERTDEYTSSLFTSDLQCQQYAARLLAIKALEEFSLDFSILPFPWLEVGEIIDLQIENDIIPERYLMTSLSIPFNLGPMTGTGKRLVIVGGSESYGEVNNG